MSIALDLTDRRVLVMGASSGLGRAVGIAASRAGARVAFAARREDRLADAAAEAGGETLVVPCNVTSADACATAIDATVAGFGGLDAFVYAAGMSPLAMLADAGEAEWRGVLDVNVVGASLLTAAALPHLRESQGRAVYVSSYSVRQSLPGLGLYRVSKVALDALIECWRMEHPDVDFTRAVVGNTAGTEFADAWEPERLREALGVWVERNLFPSATMMSTEVCAEALLSVLAMRGYVDDLAIMPRTRDTSARPPTESDGG